MSYDEFKDLSSEARKDDDHIYLYFDKFKKKRESKNRLCNENKNTFIENTQQTNPLPDKKQIYLYS